MLSKESSSFLPPLLILTCWVSGNMQNLAFQEMSEAFQRFLFPAFPVSSVL